MIQINSFKELTALLEGGKLTNKQVSEVVRSTMGLLLSADEEKLPRNELVKRLTDHYNEHLKLGSNIVPLFLNLV